MAIIALLGCPADCAACPGAMGPAASHCPAGAQTPVAIGARSVATSAGCSPLHTRRPLPPVSLCRGQGATVCAASNASGHAWGHRGDPAWHTPARLAPHGVAAAPAPRPRRLRHVLQTKLQRPRLHLRLRRRVMPTCRARKGRPQSLTPTGILSSSASSISGSCWARRDGCQPKGTQRKSGPLQRGAPRRLCRGA